MVHTQPQMAMRGGFLSRWFRKKPSASEQKSHYYPAYAQTYMQEVGKPKWMSRDYTRFAQEAYIKNVVAHRAMSLVAQCGASIPWKLYHTADGVKQEVSDHPVLRLLASPHPCMSGREFMEAVLSHRMIGGNAYILAVSPKEGTPRELYALQPERVSIIPGKGSVPLAYEYRVGDKTTRYPVSCLNGASPILHLKQFHPLSDWYGLSPVEAAAYSIDQHNQAAMWNQALLQNGAKPSGALMVKATDGGQGVLTDEQFTRIRKEVDEHYSGAANAGRPLLLEGGLEWKEMSLSPRDMDFMECKHSAARDIALAFGVPPQLLGIPGDNTYNNMAEARLALWEQTVLPLMENVTNGLNNWLLPQFGVGLILSLDTDHVSALSLRREAIWRRLQSSDFMTVNEKRKAIGLSPIEDGDRL